MRFPTLVIAAVLCTPAIAAAQTPPFAQQVFKQLIEINTTDAHGTTVAARAMQQRFLQAGFPASDAVLVGDNPNKQNLVVHYHGSGAKPPILLIGHLDVVEARRQDWSTDPFQLVVKNGVFYGRGTQDMKSGDAIYVADLIRLKQEHYVPDRDILLALTAAEEGGSDNGVDWLLNHRPDLIGTTPGSASVNAAPRVSYVLNADGGGVVTLNGKPEYMTVDASEKLYADFQLALTNPGGHSSLPRPDNAIYHLAAALGRLQRYTFPAELNAVTRGFFAARAKLDSGANAADERAIVADGVTAGAGVAAAARLSRNMLFNATLHTTCVPTRLAAGDANNALPQNAEAIVNCRIMPGHSAREVQQKLVAIFADPEITVRYEDDTGALHADAPTTVSSPPAALNPEVMQALTRLSAQLFAGAPVVPDMATGASDGKYTNARGIPTLSVSGIALAEGGDRAHGRDEDVSVASFDHATEFEYRLLKALTGGR